MTASAGGAEAGTSGSATSSATTTSAGACGAAATVGGVTSGVSRASGAICAGPAGAAGAGAGATGAGATGAGAGAAATGADSTGAVATGAGATGAGAGAAGAAAAAAAAARRPRGAGGSVGTGAGRPAASWSNSASAESRRVEGAARGVPADAAVASGAVGAGAATGAAAASGVGVFGLTRCRRRDAVRVAQSTQLATGQRVLHRVLGVECGRNDRGRDGLVRGERRVGVGRRRGRHRATLLGLVLDVAVGADAAVLRGPAGRGRSAALWTEVTRAGRARILRRGGRQVCFVHRLWRAAGAEGGAVVVGHRCATLRGVRQRLCGCGRGDGSGLRLIALVLPDRAPRLQRRVLKCRHVLLR